MGREDQLAALHDTLRQSGSMAALVGRAGAGKSHCARTFARQWFDADLERWAWWVASETTTELRVSYVEMLAALGPADPQGAGRGRSRQTGAMRVGGASKRSFRVAPRL
jgi:hypothetical protein